MESASSDNNSVEKRKLLKLKGKQKPATHHRDRKSNSNDDMESASSDNNSVEKRKISKSLGKQKPATHHRNRKVNRNDRVLSDGEIFSSDNDSGRFKSKFDERSRIRDRKSEATTKTNNHHRNRGEFECYRFDSDHDLGNNHYNNVENHHPNMTYYEPRQARNGYTLPPGPNSYGRDCHYRSPMSNYPDVYPYSLHPVYNDAEYYHPNRSYDQHRYVRPSTHHPNIDPRLQLGKGGYYPGDRIGDPKNNVFINNFN
jgi:hypothetical protein